MRYPYCTDIKDIDTGIDVILDFECEVEVSLGDDGSSSVDAVWLGNHDLLVSKDPFSSWLAKRVADAAENEISVGGWLFDAVAEAEGICFMGLGPNDPDGRVVRAF